ncbi:restriction endonuclease [Methanosarcina barkeri]|uniref:restriction endonuclease n=1 Tax=Methanosarcina barkeri TaxID=2208 RepID=UPI00064E1B33|nr:restriction endonuclease [Methanosarcina barkeri]
MIVFSSMCFLKFLKRPEISGSRDINVTLTKIDVMEGEYFENFLKSVFENLGYSVKGTKRTGDQGADLILSKDMIKIAVQVKRYSSKVSNKAVQEVVASKVLYKCTEGLVVTNNYFTNSAIELAKANSI